MTLFIFKHSIFWLLLWKENAGMTGDQTKRTVTFWISVVWTLLETFGIMYITASNTSHISWNLQKKYTRSWDRNCSVLPAPLHRFTPAAIIWSWPLHVISDTNSTADCLSGHLFMLDCEVPLLSGYWFWQKTLHSNHLSTSCSLHLFSDSLLSCSFM